jgi:hypothetical protein
MSIFRDNKRRSPTGQRTSAPPPSSGVSHIADLVAAVAARNAEELSATSPVHVSSGSGKLVSPVRLAARQRAVKLIRQAISPISLGELACIVDAQPQHIGLALSETDPSKPFAAENFVLLAERRPKLVGGVVRAFVGMVDEADEVEAIGHDLIRLAREMRSRGMEVGQ